MTSPAPFVFATTDPTVVAGLAQILSTAASRRRELGKDELPWLVELADLLISASGRQVPTDRLPALHAWLAEVKSATSQPPWLLRVGEAARLLAVSPRAIERLLEAGELPRVHIGKSVRIHVEDLEAYIKRKRDRGMSENR